MHALKTMLSAIEPEITGSTALPVFPITSFDIKINHSCSMIFEYVCETFIKKYRTVKNRAIIVKNKKGEPKFNRLSKTAKQ